MGPLTNGHDVMPDGEEATVEERWGEVFRRLGVVEATVAGQTVLLGEFARRAEKTLDDLDRTLHGTDAQPGLAIRVDRLERVAENATKQRGYLWAILATIVAAVLLTRIEACERMVQQQPKAPAVAS